MQHPASQEACWRLPATAVGAYTFTNADKLLEQFSAALYKAAHVYAHPSPMSTVYYIEADPLRPLKKLVLLLPGLTR